MTSLPVTHPENKVGNLDDQDNTRATDLTPDAASRFPTRDRFGITPKEHKPSVARDVEEDRADADGIKDDSQNVARNAWIAIRDAIEAADSDTREANYLAARSALDDLWGHAKHRDMPFRDLLAILTAATKYTPFESFGETQLGLLRDAFYDLSRWLIDDDIVMKHIERFAEYGIDISGPITAQPAKKYNVSIQEIE